MNHTTIWTAIDRLAECKHMSCSRLAKASGLDGNTFNRSKRFSRDGKPRWPSMHSIAKVLSATNSEFSEFAKFLSY